MEIENGLEDCEVEFAVFILVRSTGDDEFADSMTDGMNKKGVEHILDDAALSGEC